MRRIKIFLVAVVLLLALLYLITLFLPSRVTVSKSTQVNASRENVATQSRDFNKWKNWHPLFQNEDISVNITQNHDTSSATLVNADRKILSFILLNSSPADIEVSLLQHNKVKDMYQFILIPNGAGNTQLTWNINTDLGWNPWRRLAGIFMDKVKGPQYEAALQSLKTAAETMQH